MESSVIYIYIYIYRVMLIVFGFVALVLFNRLTI